jgi:hypothetical protein
MELRVGVASKLRKLSRAGNLTFTLRRKLTAVCGDCLRLGTDASGALAMRSLMLTVNLMPIVLPLKKMSRDEKLRAMEALWADLSQDEDQFESPAWHEQALREAERAVKTGKAQFSEWDEAKKRIRRKAAKLA